ncbi:MAG TPA: hypothetical protein VF158_02225, partial [Longimicrobiales bacterium]
ADGFVQPFGHAPQAMTLYVRFVDLGTGLGGGSQGVFYIGDAARAGLPRFECWASSAGTYTLKHHNGVVEVSSPAPGGLTAYRDVVEFRCSLRPDGAVQLNWAVNGGAEASGPVTAPNPFAPAWGGAALYLNSLGSVFKGYAGFFDLVALRGSDWTMDQIRQFLA